ncbi:MAG: Rdx family protein [Candidatus Cloacimonetes bacterium]|nr:Rdx family protein [Candidatus Cloacimonadota bacterium]MCA9785674.1 Rdx family protein [Candidatus Cloacimonadota bacterium]
MADFIRKKTGHDSTLIAGSGGVFDVVVDGRLIYSKKQTGRFPEPEEILAHLAGT